MEWYTTIYGFWERIEDERQRQKLTYKDLKKRCGFSAGGGRFLSEQYNPNLSSFVKLCNGLNVTADYLLFGKKSEQESLEYFQSFDIDAMWTRINKEIIRQDLTKNELATKCCFAHGNLYNNRSIALPYFARVCAELHVSADYILFGI